MWGFPSREGCMKATERRRRQTGKAVVIHPQVVRCYSYRTQKCCWLDVQECWCKRDYCNAVTGLMPPTLTVCLLNVLATGWMMGSNMWSEPHDVNYTFWQLNLSSWLDETVDTVICEINIRCTYMYTRASLICNIGPARVKTRESVF